MTIMEIIAGVLMALASLVIILMVLSQDSKGQGLSGVITGTEMMSNETRAHSKEMRQAKATRIAAIVFFVLVLVVNVFSVMGT